MLAVDFVGLFITACIVGLRYPQYVLVAALLHGMGQLMMALFLHGKIDLIVAAGAFSIAKVSNIGTYSSVIFMFSGVLANYIMACSFGGVEKEPSARLFNPFARLRCPFAVINLRLALVSLFVNVAHIL